MKTIIEYQLTSQGQNFEAFTSKKKAIARGIEWINAGYKNVFLYKHSKLENNTCFLTVSVKIK